MAAVRKIPPVSEPKTAVEVAKAAPKATKMPDTHALGAELEGLAAAAGRFWHALGEAGLPKGFKVAMFDNWQKGYWDPEDEDATSVEDEIEEGYEEA